MKIRQEECVGKLIQLTVYSYITTIDKTKKEVREIDLKLESTLPNSE